MAGWHHKILSMGAWGAVGVLLLAPIALARHSLCWSNSAGWHVEFYGGCAELWVPTGRHGRPGGFLPLGWSLEHGSQPWRLLPRIRAGTDGSWHIVTAPLWLVGTPIGGWLLWKHRCKSEAGARCSSCGYSLAGLGPSSQRCPECGVRRGNARES